MYLERHEKLQKRWRGSGPSEVCLQGPASNCLCAALAKDRCRERQRKSGVLTFASEDREGEHQ